MAVSRSKATAYAIPCNFAAKATWASPRGNERGSFRPKGNPAFSSKKLENRCSTRTNPVAWSSESPTTSARLFVGFNIKEVPTYSMEHLVTLVKKVRQDQHSIPDSSFLYQRGVYTHEDDGKVITEDGAQIIILHLDKDKTAEQFQGEMIQLAEIICTKMSQEKVFVDIQEGGVSKKVIAVVAA